jgi:hypothetical protein
VLSLEKFNYSFDVRGKPLQQARHWSAPEIFGSRAKFNANADPATLDIEVRVLERASQKPLSPLKQCLLQDIRRHDEGVYRCRVDFRTSQTQSFRYNLTVISKSIVDGSQQRKRAGRGGGKIHHRRVSRAKNCVVRRK